jgi:hypothetical protein
LIQVKHKPNRAKVKICVYLGYVGGRGGSEIRVEFEIRVRTFFDFENIRVISKF